jgi:hypothetical protein|tara:strand:- start:84 stop:437 length:354 start_codon:yes stop_codon:yes gene_type:complete
MSIVITAIQSGFRKLKEPRCWSIGFHTQEIDNDIAIRLAETNDQLVKVVISIDNISQEVIELVEKVPLDKKEKWTKSQKLRFAIQNQAVQANLIDKDEIEAYYSDKMDKIIQWIKTT